MSTKSSEAREALATSVYIDIRNRIRGADIRQGDRLVDTTIAAELGVSRMPVREAMLRLVHEGYLVGTTRGFMLPELSRKDVLDIFEVRKLIEPRAAALAAYHLDMEGTIALEANYRSAVEAVERSEYQPLADSIRNFRQAWMDAVPNDRLTAIITRFADHVQVVQFSTLRDASTRQVVIKLLADQLQGFQARNPIAVHDHMVTFLINAEERFFHLMQPEE